MDDEMEVNERGGKQSKLDMRLDLVDAAAILWLGHVLFQGANAYGEENWRLIGRNSHLNHALVHIFQYLEEARLGHFEDMHLAHAFCRLMFALATEENRDSDWTLRAYTHEEDV